MKALEKTIMVSEELDVEAEYNNDQLSFSALNTDEMRSLDQRSL